VPVAELAHRRDPVRAVDQHEPLVERENDGRVAEAVVGPQAADHSLYPARLGLLMRDDLGERHDAKVKRLTHRTEVIG
jgi:hypothetical protein